MGLFFFAFRTPPHHTAPHANFTNQTAHLEGHHLPQKPQKHPAIRLATRLDVAPKGHLPGPPPEGGIAGIAHFTNQTPTLSAIKLEGKNWY